jgi:hypothetical protein
VLSGRGLCDKLITYPEECYRLMCVVVCDLETPRIGAPYIYDISHLRVNIVTVRHPEELAFANLNILVTSLVSRASVSLVVHWGQLKRWFYLSYCCHQMGANFT